MQRVADGSVAVDSHGSQKQVVHISKLQRNIIGPEREREIDLHHMDRCSALCGSLNGRRVWGRMNTDICMAESLCCLPETYITLLIGYTPIKIELKKK